MEATIYRYKIKDANWGEGVMNEANLINIAELLMKQPFYGEGNDPETRFGFTQCGYLDGKVFGLFIQKYPAILIDYDPVTKEEKQREIVDCGEYLFILDLNNYEVFLQAKNSSDLPGRSEINKRFVFLLIRIFDSLGYFFRDIEVTEDVVDRDKMVRLFYEVSDRVLEMAFEGFDMNLIKEEKRKRDGKRQTYFNPKEDYQEAMEEGAIKLAQHAEKATVKAKEGESLKKDPITRAMLEGSRKPLKIVYTAENEIHTAYGVDKSKEVINVDGDSYSLKNQIHDIISRIFTGDIGNRKKKDDNNNQSKLEF